MSASFASAPAPSRPSPPRPPPPSPTPSAHHSYCPTTPNAHTALITLTVSQSSISYQLFAFARAAHQRRRAGNVAGSAGKRNDDVRTCSLSNTEGSTQGTYNGRSTSAGQGGQQQGDGSKSGQQSMEGVTQHRNRNAAAAQQLDLRSINSREAQPVAGSLRLFLAALFPIFWGISGAYHYCLPGGICWFSVNAQTLPQSAAHQTQPPVPPLPPRAPPIC